MLRIYHSPGTRSQRVIWTCEELGLPYEVVHVDFSQAYRSSPEWRRLSPVGKVPVMTDGELTMFESCAMVQYILDRYGAGRLQPAAGTPEHALFLQWIWFGESTFSRALGEIVAHRRAFPDGDIEPVVAEFRRRGFECAEAVSAALADRPYLLGETFSAADIVVGHALRSCRSHVPGPLPDVAGKYLDRLLARPAWAATAAADTAS